MIRVDWKVSPDLVAYPEAVAAMEARVEAIRAGEAREQVWLLEHPPLYTAGTSADPADLIDPHRLPVFSAGRGGQYTFHGPGQRIAYVMLDLSRRNDGRGPDLHAFVEGLERWLIDTLARFDVEGERRPGRVGVWVALEGGREAKIAAIGVRVRHWISFHGVSLNVDPELDHYRGIVPCGVKEHGVTSLAALGIDASMNDIDIALRETFEKVFDG